MRTTTYSRGHGEHIKRKIDMTLDDIADSVGTITENRDDSRDEKFFEGTDDDFDPEDSWLDLEEYDGGWDTDH